MCVCFVDMLLLMASSNCVCVCVFILPSLLAIKGDLYTCFLRPTPYIDIYTDRSIAWSPHAHTPFSPWDETRVSE